MTDIRSSTPFILQIEQVGVDEGLSAIQVHLHIKTTFFEHTSELRLNGVWFLSSSLSQFKDSLMANQPAVLIDINSTLFIQVTAFVDDYTILINYKRRYNHGQENSTELIIKLDKEALIDLQDHFKLMLV
ncbi:hypothetical protein GO755_36915 [Spirosoma sp. HMF4905]|uniref:Uncharacterized protein n=1 Tax=Spirosoma arboris TaxID=2682092 RepID=A0A7K1SPY4_9BACT|nr:hypothetical protein [Spirosoma arboris]MVM35656.1 hypothetical protein [Spirosoma arboris]